ncbi:MAG TPA: 3-hydroxyacyl-CoA dehydrogenase [Ktedonobacteraceae bacterium]|nr:3-hydroxyacyl-CoA dehydrogenase [Ktedonobacteraceae bacterium]
MELQDKGVLVTGGASGLGAACVRLLSEQGAKVAIADLNTEAGETLATQLRGNGSHVSFVQTDVASEASMQAAVQAAVQHAGYLHILINCAGIGVAEKVFGKAGVHNLERFQKVISVNLIGTFNAIRLAVAAMAENEPTAEGERGVIISTASVAAFEGQIGQAAYSASKGGIVGMTLPIAREVANLGVRVVAIAPGLFDTPLLGGLPEPARASLGQQVPFPSRLGQPAEYAALARHIIENPMLNGTTIRLDGALRMGPR